MLEQIRKTDVGKACMPCANKPLSVSLPMRKEKHAMRYTHHRGLARVTQWVTLKFAAMNLKKLALWHSPAIPTLSPFFLFFHSFYFRRRFRAFA